MKRNDFSKNGKSEDESTKIKDVLIYHTPTHGELPIYNVTVVGVEMVDGTVKLGLSICYPFDNFSRKKGRNQAYGKCFKVNRYRSNGKLRKEPSYLSYHLSPTKLHRLNFVKSTDELDKKRLKSFMARVGDNIAQEMQEKTPVKAYPICQEVIDQAIEKLEKEPEGMPL